MSENYYLISQKDFNSFGCPNCYCHENSIFSEFFGGYQTICSSCRNIFYVQTISNISVFDYLNKEEVSKIIKFNRDSIKPCQKHNGKCKQKAVELFATGTVKTPGCFINGGKEDDRDCLILKTETEAQAKDIVSLFSIGALSAGKYILVGCDPENFSHLYRMILHVAKHNSIDYNAINSVLNEKISA